MWPISKIPCPQDHVAFECIIQIIGKKLDAKSNIQNLKLHHFMGQYIAVLEMNLMLDDFFELIVQIREGLKVFIQKYEQTINSMMDTPETPYSVARILRVKLFNDIVKLSEQVEHSISRYQSLQDVHNDMVAKLEATDLN